MLCLAVDCCYSESVFVRFYVTLDYGNYFVFCMHSAFFLVICLVTVLLLSSYIYANKLYCCIQNLQKLLC